ncbi:MAG: hypothetical protein ACFFBP_17365 [Promethearchaeota archaeon]
MSACYPSKKYDCWNGCDEELKEEIRRNAFVKEIRAKLMKKKCKQILDN